MLVLEKTQLYFTPEWLLNPSGTHIYLSPMYSTTCPITVSIFLAFLAESFDDTSIMVVAK